MNLFTLMLKEEWRMHSTLFGSLNFAMFPILIFAISFMLAFILPVMHTVVDASVMILTMHLGYCMIGIMSGSFGILGKEMMNRRFGDGSLLIYSARTLPLSNRRIFTDFVLKDTLYYFFLWILPCGAGFILASPFANGIGILGSCLLLLTLTLSYMFGMCGVFLLSSIYSKSKAALGAVIAAILLLGIIISLIRGDLGIKGIVNTILLPAHLFTEFSITTLAVCLIVIAVLFTAAIMLFSPESRGDEKRYKSNLIEFSESAFIRKVSTLFKISDAERLIFSKDLLDLHRSGIGIGQTIFTLILPICLIYVVLYVLADLLRPDQIFMVIVMVSGITASTIYTWLTEFDAFSAYIFLPVKVSSIMKAKIMTFSLLQIIPVVLVILFAFATGAYECSICGAVMTVSISYYAMSVMVKYAGLSPSLIIYNVRFFIRYMLYLIPVSLLSLALSFVSPVFAYVSVIFLVLAYFMLKTAFKKWDSADQIFGRIE